MKELTYGKLLGYYDRGKGDAMPKAKRNDKAVKIDRDLALKAKLIAETKELSVAEYLSGILRPVIEKDWPIAVKHVDKK